MRTSCGGFRGFRSGIECSCVLVIELEWGRILGRDNFVHAENRDLVSVSFCSRVAFPAFLLEHYHFLCSGVFFDCHTNLTRRDVRTTDHRVINRANQEHTIKEEFLSDLRSSQLVERHSITNYHFVLKIANVDYCKFLFYFLFCLIVR